MISHKKVEIPSYYFARYWTVALCNAQTQPQTFNIFRCNLFIKNFSRSNVVGPCLSLNLFKMTNFSGFFFN